MSTPDRLATFTRWRLEIILTMTSVVGVGGFVHEIFLTADPNWIKIVASSAAVAGAPAALYQLAARGLGPPPLPPEAPPSRPPTQEPPEQP